jgi:hypothetical protein
MKPPVHSRGRTRRIIRWLIPPLALVLGFSAYIVYEEAAAPSFPCAMTGSQKGNDTREFILQPGDILARPNWNWLPGSSRVPSGRYFGHVAIVVRGARGPRIREVLEQAVVVEALLFDQVTRKFLFGSKDIVRKVPASYSFGQKFEGIRYRLRTRLDDRQLCRLITFLNLQLNDDRYDVFPVRRHEDPAGGAAGSFRPADAATWNCATLARASFLFATGTDPDANEGCFVYPNDLISSPLFNNNEGRIRF